MAEFFCTDVHQKIFAIRVLRSLGPGLSIASRLQVRPWPHRIVPKVYYRIEDLADRHAHGIHERFDVMIHRGTLQLQTRATRGVVWFLHYKRAGAHADQIVIVTGPVRLTRASDA